MTPKTFRKYLDRDWYCWHCGREDGTLIPQHRLNRGSGGSKVRDVPSNIIVFCAEANSRAESDSRFAAECRVNGWKLSSWQNPLLTPVYDVMTRKWYFLDDEFGRTLTSV